jgi:very-short-patch-repair endonuclease
LKGVGGCKNNSMCANKLLSYNPKLKELARELRKNSTLAEVILWQNIKGKVFEYEFHRQVPINEFIVDFFCHELQLAIEIDGNTHDYNFENDKSRQKILESLGIKFIRFNDNDVKRNLNDVLRALELMFSEIEETDKKQGD